MTTAELHEILDNEERKLTADELKEVIYQLKQDVFAKYSEALEHANLHISQYYCGESNAFQICLDLLEHLKEATTDETPDTPLS